MNDVETNPFDHPDTARQYLEGLSDGELIDTYKEWDQKVIELDQKDVSEDSEGWLTANNNLDLIADECLNRGINIE